MTSANFDCFVTNEKLVRWNVSARLKGDIAIRSYTSCVELFPVLLMLLFEHGLDA